MREVVLYGRLKKKFGGPFKLEVATAGEAIRALNVCLKGFAQELEKGAYEVVRGARKSGMHLELGDVNEFRLGKADLHIVPVLKGSKSGGVMKAILGVALVGAAIFFAPAAGGLSAAIGSTGLTYGNMAMVGVALSLAGVSSMLTSKNKSKKSDSDTSFTVNGPGNSYEQGNSVPLIYGEVITGSQLISGGLDIENIGAWTEAGNSSGSTSGNSAWNASSSGSSSGSSGTGVSTGGNGGSSGSSGAGGDAGGTAGSGNTAWGPGS
ncbi:Phage-related protein, tail component [Faunimonas pinastri]|uniref:Phage-related protein, tail component n=1 Tax=Faunimonas pinastri TaxID=1855383 RepID=A0A1H9N3A8_9HYPH|nr:tail assembly protein [Faunimonas pinastri]SER29873.1 Phage-related protein, tail component [Faunimonas pinastri]